jgi:branched-subunit amino acid aminotransferase/4-amino-4-deoxychorismate lyase
MANLFWAKNGEMFTPSLNTGCLAGTTREYVLEGLECREVEVGIEALEAAEDIFLTSAGVGIVQVDEFNGRPMQLGRYGIMNDII